MHHLGGRANVRLAGDEDDAAPVADFHGRQQRARHAHAAHDVDVEEVLPLAVVDLLERTRIENAAVVHQNIDRTRRLSQVRAAGRRADVGLHRIDLGAGHRGAQPLDRLRQALRIAAVDDDRGAFGSQLTRDRQADARR